jgi:hypothetical protein
MVKPHLRRSSDGMTIWTTMSAKQVIDIRKSGDD